LELDLKQLNEAQAQLVRDKLLELPSHLHTQGEEEVSISCGN
jgi:hypothetical protein